MMDQVFQGNNPFANPVDEDTNIEGTIDDDKSNVTEDFLALLTDSQNTIARLEARLANLEQDQMTMYQSPPSQYVPHPHLHCNSGYRVIFDSEECRVYHGSELVLCGTCNKSTRLCTLPIAPKRKPQKYSDRYVLLMMDD